MGIISDFLNVNLEIEKLKNNDKFFDKLLYRFKKKKLYDTVEKIKMANEPIDKDQIMELLQSLYGISVGDGEPFFDHHVIIEYFPRNGFYRLTVKTDNTGINEVIQFQLVTSNKQKTIELVMQVKEKKDIIKNYKIDVDKINTNIKELQNYVKFCNNELYRLIYLYISATIVK